MKTVLQKYSQNKKYFYIKIIKVVNLTFKHIKLIKNILFSIYK